MTKELKDYLQEEWHLVDGYFDTYSVSNWGRVINIKKSKILKTPLSGNGYPSVYLYHPKMKPRRFLVHRLVGEYFVPNPHNKNQINHRFGDKLDNYFEHLEWVTCGENINHAFDTGLNRKVIKNEPKRSIPSVRMDISGNELQKYPSQSEAARQMNVSASNINHAIRHKTICNGYYWK